MKYFHYICLFLIFTNFGGSLQDTSETHITPKGESSKLVINPDQGFYRPLVVTVGTNGVSYGTTNPDSLYHLRCDISAFCKATNGNKDIEITQAALNGISSMLTKIRGEGKNAVIRFAYDGFKGIADRECGIDMIKKHIKQLGPVLNQFPDVLTAVEVGLLGMWGEMHSSKIITPENLNIVITAWLENTKKLPVLSRQPKFIYYFCNGKTKISEVESINFSKSDKGYYLGMYNDGMFGSDSDLGTWLQDRKREMTWIAKNNAHLPYGGEATVGDSSTSVVLMKNCIPEMFMNHLSYLNYEFNQKVFDKWKNEKYTSSIAGNKAFEGKSAYDFVNAHFGYRLVITDISGTISNHNLKLVIKVDNRGFGYINKVKKIGIVYSYDGKTSAEGYYGLETYTGNQNMIKIECPIIEGASANYKVYLRMYHTESNYDVTYPVKFANEGIYNDKLKGNYLFTINKKNNQILA